MRILNSPRLSLSAKGNKRLPPIMLFEFESRNNTLAQHRKRLSH